MSRTKRVAISALPQHSGNIKVLSLADPSNIQLEIRPDPYCEHDKTTHFQWFYYRVAGAKGKELVMHIVNAGKASFPEAWPGYRGCASYDHRYWFRVSTEYDESGGVLTLRHTPEHDAVFYAFFAPYQWHQHQQLVACCQMKPRVTLEVPGSSLDGHDLDLVVVGDPLREDGDGRKAIWVIARQHPGESMAEWFMEGMLHRLTDKYDPLAGKLLKHATFYTVPNINPDGTIRGHLRTNAVGANLNREWDNPSPERSPEVFHVLRKMDEVGCDLFLDIHGDEEIPTNFLAGTEGIPSFNDRLNSLELAFSEAFARASPDFDTKPGYAVDPPGGADMSIACNAVAERFHCLSFTLEMPFKDTLASEDPAQGWSPERASRFGASILHPIHEVLMLLRDEEKMSEAREKGFRPCMGQCKPVAFQDTALEDLK